MSDRDLSSWGRIFPDRGRRVVDAGSGVRLAGEGEFLPYGNGRSYGDSCLNDQGTLVDGRCADAILSFDAETGVVTAEAGVLLAAITRLAAPHGWFLPVTPGTQFVTLGGAIANDVHGKNHHRRGTFGCWVRAFDLERSDRGRIACSATENAELFAATIGGMGLTGLMRTATLQLLRVPSLTIRETTTRFDRLADYFDLAEAADERHEYAVAWIDSLSRGSSLGRGHLIAGDHAAQGDRQGVARPPLARVPFTPPVSPLRGWPLRAFNEAYFRKSPAGTSERLVAFDSFFYPLDRVGQWNRLYGPRGLHQHQSLVPFNDGKSVVAELLGCAGAFGQGSFLTVLKRFGAGESPGLLSFPRPGYTLTLDFPHRGAGTLRMLNELDRITIAAGGRVNPYKDARMGAETFAASFPAWQTLENLRDPAILSDFWRRTALRLKRESRANGLRASAEASEYSPSSVAR
ncbi:FAD-linked oxidase [Aureimonas sp. SA4125]|uniref:FAD-binding oxidoreductase n=1 Tax=Aureimonas sp. SA4125 TaxID=2826993 RepID=UPI001CC5CD28|nr:FAD-binding oxidoreductase [Aureimonas sp. SA4125]BDA85344.1 FAD-linked oxidase [Aureimonas sp. SA4125]